MVALLAAFQFLTIFPEVIRRPLTPREVGRAAGWYALVGLVLGGFLYGLHLVCARFFPAPVTAALVLTAWVAATRALHLDGFMDSCDGLFGGFTPERRLEIMRDPRVGAFGVAGGVLLLLTKYAALASLSGDLSPLLVAPMFARWGLTLAIFIFPYAREHGLGRDVKDNLGWREVALASATTLIGGWMIGAWTGILMLAASTLVLFVGARLILRLIPGLTGDSYGMLTELTEVAVLLIFLAIR